LFGKAEMLGDVGSIPRSARVCKGFLFTVGFTCVCSLFAV